MATLDLNADVGEGMPTDSALLDVVTSASVACGLHAGDASTMRAVCEAAAARGVVVGAHVSYRDREGFGRRELAVAPDVIEAETREQIAALASVGARVSYVKPHGALYHRAARDPAVAAAIVRGSAAVGAMLGPPGSELLAAARAAGLDAVAEGFADRGYLSDGTLVARGRPGALLGDDEAVAQGLRLASEGLFRSLCLHGDSPGAVAVAQRLARELAAAGVELRAFA